MRELPLNGRNIEQLILLAPGAVAYPNGQQSALVGRSAPFSISGSRPEGYANLLDGENCLNWWQRGCGAAVTGTTLGIEAIAEFQTLTANYSAEYGRSSAGQIRFVTKSGGQAFHGNLVENFRNSALDANSWTRNHSPNRSEFGGPAPFRFNQFGYDLNGPIFIPKKFNADKSKYFFLWAQEWIRRREEQNPTALVPSLAMRNGDFSELLSPTNVFFSRVRTVTDPNTKAPYPGNIIPITRLSPNGRALLRAYPAPTPGLLQPGTNFIGSGARGSNTLKNTLKVDYAINSNHRLSVRGTHIPVANCAAEELQIVTARRPFQYPCLLPRQAPHIPRDANDVEAFQRLVQSLAEQFAVRKIGQTIVVRHMRNLVFALTALGNVLVSSDPAAVRQRPVDHGDDAAVGTDEGYLRRQRVEQLRD